MMLLPAADTSYVPAPQAEGTTKDVPVADFGIDEVLTQLPVNLREEVVAEDPSTGPQPGVEGDAKTNHPASPIRNLVWVTTHVIEIIPNEGKTSFPLSYSYPYTFFSLFFIILFSYQEHQYWEKDPWMPLILKNLLPSGRKRMKG